MEEAEQASSLHQLSDDPEGLGGGTDGEEGDEVTVAKSLQHLGFLLEVLVVELRVCGAEKNERRKKEAEVEQL